MKKSIKNKRKKKNEKTIKYIKEVVTDKEKKKFKYLFLFLIIIFSIGLVRKTFQNDTFYTIKIGELILKNGIDMMDHFSWHSMLAYTYPHWLYDVFIYLVYYLFGYTGLYLSTIILLIILILLVFNTNIKNTDNYVVSIFSTFICILAISGFATARAQMLSFILFVLEIFFIEMFLKNKKKKYLYGLLLISLIICNTHVAVWIFYFILYLPCLVEFLIAYILDKIRKKNENNKLVVFCDKKFDIEKNDNVKYLFIVMLLSLLTGLITPIGDTPYTYIFKTMMGNSQKYINEHQMISWANSPFTIIIAIETIFLAFMAKVKLRDLFMICGLVIMSIFSIRHISLLALIGTICFARVFYAFLCKYDFNVDELLIKTLLKKSVIISSYIIVIISTFLLLYYQNNEEYIDHELYPIDAVKYIKENLDISEIKLFNGYNYGSYLVLNDIPVFIDSRADLYTKQFSGFDYDMFDDYEFIATNYQEKFEFYGITHVLLSREEEDILKLLEKDNCYNKIYSDNYFVLFEKTGHHDVIVNFSNN